MNWFHVRSLWSAFETWNKKGKFNDISLFLFLCSLCLLRSDLFKIVLDLHLFTLFISNVLRFKILSYMTIISIIWVLTFVIICQIKFSWRCTNSLCYRYLQLVQHFTFHSWLFWFCIGRYSKQHEGALEKGLEQRYSLPEKEEEFSGSWKKGKTSLFRKNLRISQTFLKFLF